MEDVPDSRRLEDEGYEPVCRLEDVPHHIPRRVEVGDRGILICREGDEVFALDELCPHRNQSMQRAPVGLGKITCPHHRFGFDLRTGECDRRCAPVETFEAAVVDGRVWVRGPS